MDEVDDGRKVGDAQLWSSHIRVEGVVLKGFVNLIMLGLMSWYVYEVRDTQWTCIADMELSLCIFRYFMAGAAALFLLPYLNEAFMVNATLLAVLEGKSEVLVGRRGEVLAVNEMGKVYFNGSSWRVYGGVIVALLKLPARLLGSLGQVRKGVHQLLVLVDVVQTVTLPFFAVLFVITSTTPTEIFINFIIAQSLARIDDEIVLLIVNRKSHVHSILTPFFKKRDRVPRDVSLFLEQGGTPPRVLVAYGLV
ncbi:Hypothetical Protein FCC1311_023842 [Hondaea fermentalgiana]|uniref:Uncharacterized protein n=1 Tax=Hondaea fermentalgiana TaxID=2315210 RepID=A0A2R5GEB6_9STRA|nr:Hypothetical Protein FCC1311_023842 [Hondaea fermentalgiana]|eukprot:GBG26164.1 Hypothetical Protein FCC1311_023842 [Hondaea fermentalgiana]